MDEKTKKLLADIHNALVTTHPTGDDIVTIANIIMTIRTELAEANSGGEGSTNE